MFCTNCGRELPEGASFCDGCGKPVAQNKHHRKNRLPIVLGTLSCIAAIIALIVLVIIPAYDNMARTGNGTNPSALMSRANDAYASDGVWLFYSSNTIVPSVTDDSFSVIAQIRKVKFNGHDDQPLFTFELENCIGEDDALLDRLFVYDGRVYFRQGVYSNGNYSTSLRSVRIDGSDPVDLSSNYSELDALNLAWYIISDGFIFVDDGTTIFSIPVDSQDWANDAVPVYDINDYYNGAGNYALYNWIVDEGFIYTSEGAHIGAGWDNNEFTVRRRSLEDEHDEILYVSDRAPLCPIPYRDHLYLTESQRDEIRDLSFTQLISINMESGDTQTLYYDWEDNNTDNILAWSVSDDGVILITGPAMLSEQEHPFAIHEIGANGIGECEIYSYDCSWAGDLMQSRNVGGNPLAYPQQLFVFDRQVFFIPVSYEAYDAILMEDPSGPISYSICKVDITDGRFEEVATVSSYVDY